MKDIKKSIKKTYMAFALSCGLPLLTGATEIQAKPSYTKQEIECLSLAAYHEDRGSKEAMVAVMNVVNNRAKHKDYPDNVCNVIAQPYQFSFYKHRRVIKEKEKFEEARQIAKDFSRGKYGDNTHGSLYFHAKRVNPYWVNKVIKVKSIGGHIFYKKPTKTKNF